MLLTGPKILSHPRSQNMKVVYKKKTVKLKLVSKTDFKKWQTHNFRQEMFHPDKKDYLYRCFHCSVAAGNFDTKSCLECSIYF